MAKKTAQPDAVTVRYDLHELPTAQHKAGLAGLILQIESMNERKRAGALPEETPLVEVLDEGPTYAELRFMAESTQALFDDLYAANIIEIAVDKKWSGKAPKRIDKEAERPYVYDVVQPAGPFLARYTDDGKETWHKLWRDMLWAIPRGKPTTRGPFNARAEGKPTKDGADAWKGLVAHVKAVNKGEIKAVEVAGAVMLGAQAVNAEAMKFEDRADHALLLHFWQLAVRIFVPEEVNAEGKREFVGYVLAIPEVSDLPKFCRAYTCMLNELRPQKRGYRPADAIVSLPAEGSLEFMRHLADLAERRVLEEGPSRHLDGVEFFHMLKIGNNIKTAAHGHVPPRDQLLHAYQGILAQNRNPLMIAGRLQAMLRDQPWFSELTDPLIEREWSFFVHSTQERHRTPGSMIAFAYDAGRRFKAIGSHYQELKESRMTDREKLGPKVDRLIRRLVGQYVHLRTLQRLGFRPNDPQKPWMRKQIQEGQEEERETPPYQEERRKVCSSLFLELRSRRDDDFVRHFTATLGSVNQYLPEEDYLAVAAALMRTYSEGAGEHRPRTRDDVKTLTLLALSAHSRSLTGKQDGDQRTQEITKETSE